MPASAADCTFCRGGKKPLVEGWQRGAALVEAENVGMVCGEASGDVVVLDFDTRDGIFSVFGIEPARLAELTLVAQTSRGHHVFLKAPGFGRSREVRGILVRGDGGLIVLPPSIHATGIEYRFLPGAALADRFVASAKVVLPSAFRHDFFQLDSPSSSGGNTRAPPGAAPVLPERSEVDMKGIRTRLLFSPPAFMFHWNVLQGQAEALPEGQGGRSKSDWVVSLFLAEMELDSGTIARFLLEQPGSKASRLLRDATRERAETYAALTARKACEAKQGARAVLAEDAASLGTA